MFTGAVFPSRDPTIHLKMPKELTRARSPKTRNCGEGWAKILAWRGACCGRPPPSTWKTPFGQTKWEHVCLHTLQSLHCCDRCEAAGPQWDSRGGNREEGYLSALPLLNTGSFMIRASFRSHVTSINKAWMIMLPHGPQTQESLLPPQGLSNYWTQCFRQIQSVNQGRSQKRLKSWEESPLPPPYGQNKYCIWNRISSRNEKKNHIQICGRLTHLIFWGHISSGGTTGEGNTHHIHYTVLFFSTELKWVIMHGKILSNAAKQSQIPCRVQGRPCFWLVAPFTYKADWKGCAHSGEPETQKQAASFSGRLLTWPKPGNTSDQISFWH